MKRYNAALNQRNCQIRRDFWQLTAHFCFPALLLPGYSMHLFERTAELKYTLDLNMFVYKDIWRNQFFSLNS